MKTTSTLRKVKSLFPALLLFCSFGLAGQSVHEITVTNNVFTPSSLTIQAGDEVVWTNAEGYHNVNGTQTTYPANPASFGNSPGTGWEHSCKVRIFQVPMPISAIPMQVWA
ncbi:MAG: hypothetical protein R2751_14625 [Bacteroidales bacterium]